jgi:hypothetical protein
MSQCPFCKKKISMSKAFCSKPCKESYFQIISIRVPKLFLKRIYVMCNEKERNEEILAFAKRHSWRLDLLKNRIKEEAIKAGYIEGEIAEPRTLN